VTVIDTWASTADRAMPTLLGVVTHWMEACDTIDLFPHLKAHWIGWGEPFCFRCGWLAPIADWIDHRAGGWLERAHLQDRCLGGPDEPSNIVPLCIPCHDAMPDLLDRDTAIAWVAAPHSEVAYPRLWQGFTDAHAMNSLSSGRARLYRMKAQYLEALMELPRLRGVVPRDVVVGEPAGPVIHKPGQRDAS